MIKTHFPAWNGGWIPQESVFWRRRLWEKAGSRFLTERLQYGDFELWSRFWPHAELHTVNLPLGVYRMHAATYTHQGGSRSLAPCTELLRTAAETRLGPASIRIRHQMCRTSGWARRSFGQAAWTVRFDTGSRRWERHPILVS